MSYGSISACVRGPGQIAWDRPSIKGIHENSVSGIGLTSGVVCFRWLIRPVVMEKAASKRMIHKSPNKRVKVPRIEAIKIEYERPLRSP